jgi:hypothetical protein
MDDVESIAKKAINSINTSSILKNNFGSLCDTANETHDVLLNYNHIRRLSFDTSVQRLCELYDQVIITLVPKHNELAKQLQLNSIRGCILFLKDFLPKLSSINLRLQKSNLTIIDTVLIIDKLNNTVTDIISHVKEENDLSIFPALNAFLVEKAPEVKTEIKVRVVNYLEALCNELEERFQELEFLKKTLNFVSSPFQEVCKENLRKMEERLSTFAGVTSINWSNIGFSVMQLRRDEQMRSVFCDKNATTESFWSGMYKHSETYKELAVVAILILSIFPTTVTCEKSFSAALHFIKNKYRNQLTNDNLEAALRLALEDRSVIEFPFGKVL